MSTRRNIKAKLALSIPATTAARVGRMVVKCAHIEHLLLLNQKRLLGIGIAEARSIAGTISWKGTFDRIRQLAAEKAFAFSVDMDALQRHLIVAEKRRNLLVHSSLRIDDAGRLCIFDTRGAAARNPNKMLANRGFFDESAQLIGKSLLGLQQMAADTSSLLT